jgi:ATP-dependent RNA helicase DeaD
MLNVIEKATRQKIEEFSLPSNRIINGKRIENFKKELTKIMSSEDLGVFQEIIEAYALEQDIPVTLVAAALAKQAHGNTPFLLPLEKEKRPELERPERAKPERAKKPPVSKKPSAKAPSVPVKTKVAVPPEKGMERYRIEVGLSHGVKPGNIVGAISNEAGLESRYIKNIDINQDFSLVDLPFGMPKDIFTLLKKTWVLSKPMSISKCA